MPSNSKDCRHRQILIGVSQIILFGTAPDVACSPSQILDSVVAEGAAVHKLLARKNEALLVRGDADLLGLDSFRVLDLGLHVVNSVRGIDFKRDGLAAQLLDKYLHSTVMERR